MPQRITSSINPILLHRIVREETREWDDVSIDTFRKIIEEINISWTINPDPINCSSEKWLLTFDDGYISDYEIVFPILGEFGMSAIFFLVYDFVGKDGYLSWTQIDEMQRNGMIFGSHGVSHQYLTKIPKSDAFAEMKDSKKMIQDRLGVEIQSFSFPYGDLNDELVGIASDIGYLNLFSSNHGIINNHKQVLPRNSINSTMQWPKIRSVIHPGESTKLLWRLEDFVKSFFKNLLGYERYRSFRRFFVK